MATAKSLISSFSGFDKLPEEIVKSIFQCYEPVRSFNIRGRGEDEKNRRENNRRSGHALHALCLTSQKLLRIAQPILYTTFILEGSRGTKAARLMSYIRATHRKPWLRDSLQYIEQFHDIPFKGREWSNPSESASSIGFDELIKPLVVGIWGPRHKFYPNQTRDDTLDQPLLALVIMSSPNIGHLVLEVVLDQTPSVLELIGFGGHPGRALFHGFPQLDRLHIEIISCADWGALTVDIQPAASSIRWSM
ncbi:hypothetical protein P154DRAFT_190041 [Amniculicola lignicola CBS 123094]|uniref:Uncharacterized protein n=1 Tax=Amniculicola lignicola CBS 123094 TaxID=1392246 RepID=A0A6A5WL84_9PLEO|nr:hypothetical protein P154DRAFT_190041 [Amniculicola lignicola CBS 123094]